MGSKLTESYDKAALASAMARHPTGNLHATRSPGRGVDLSGVHVASSNLVSRQSVKERSDGTDPVGLPSTRWLVRQQVPTRREHFLACLKSLFQRRDCDIHVMKRIRLYRLDVGTAPNGDLTPVHIGLNVDADLLHAPLTSLSVCGRDHTRDMSCTVCDGLACK